VGRDTLRNHGAVSITSRQLATVAAIRRRGIALPDLAEMLASQTAKAPQFLIKKESSTSLFAAVPTWRDAYLGRKQLVKPGDDGIPHSERPAFLDEVNLPDVPDEISCH